MMEEKVTILVVDDDEGHTELVRRNLRRFGLVNKIVTLDNGQHALDFVFRRGNYADRPLDDSLLILLDINMPGSSNGIDVLREIKSDPTTRKIPIIMLTTTDDSREIARCYDLGCNVYVTKPIDPIAFIDTVQKIGLFVSIVSLPGQAKE